MNDHRRIWDDANVKDYDFEAEIIEGGLSDVARPVLVQVRDDQVTSIAPVSASDRRKLDRYDRFEAVRRMFETIEENLGKEEYIELTITYDSKHGYPLKIGISEPMRGIDNWIFFEITRFTPIK